MMIPSGNDHALEAADPLELAEIKRRWKPYINQTPDYAYLRKDLLNGKMSSIKRGVRSHTVLLTPFL
ncbi:hypothetical protein [Intestinibaculum porci]|nr:hypothetical protein [Intestinibaculum porci]